jgi:hypothetical protein
MFHHVKKLNKQGRNTERAKWNESSANFNRIAKEKVLNPICRRTEKKYMFTYGNFYYARKALESCVWKECFKVLILFLLPKRLACTLMKTFDVINELKSTKAIVLNLSDMTAYFCSPPNVQSRSTPLTKMNSSLFTHVYISIMISN